MKFINSILILFCLILMLLVTTVATRADRVFYDSCNNVTQWHDNSGGMTINTVNSTFSLNGSTCQFSALDGKIMSMNFSNGTGGQTSNVGVNPFNVSFWFNLTPGIGNDIYISVTSSSDSPHWRDGATIIWLPGQGVFAINQTANTPLFNENLVTNGNKVKITIELNDSIPWDGGSGTARLHYNIYVNDVRNYTALPFFAQSVNIIDRRDLGSIGVTIVGGAAHTLYIDDIEVTNGSGSAPPPSTSTINITSGPFPLNNTQYNKSGNNNLSINLTVSSSFGFNASLYINETGALTNVAANQTKLSFPAGQNVYVEFNLSWPQPASRTYQYLIHVFDHTTSVNSSNTTFFVDNIVPVITSTMNNSRAVYNGILSETFNFTDSFQLFSYELYVDNQRWQHREELNTTLFIFNMSLNTSNLTAGVHNFTINLSDGHTANKIPEWDYTNNWIDKSLKYQFDEGYIEITPIDASLFDSFSSFKKEDRYEFVHDRFSKDDKEIYTVTSDKKIFIVQNNAYKGWLVIPELKKWIDFESDDYGTIEVNQLNDFQVDVTISDIKSDVITFHSIGTLNTVSKTFQFYVGNATSTIETPVLETEEVEYLVVFEYNSTQVTDINVHLFWNNSDLNYTTKTRGTTQINFTRLFIIPNIDADQSFNVFWNYTIFGANGTNDINQTPTQSQLVYDIGLNQCDETNTNATLTFSPKNEENLSWINDTDVDVTFELFLNQTLLNLSDIPPGVNKSFAFTDKINYTVCLNAFNRSFMADAVVSYQAATFSQRNHYLSNFPMGNGTWRVVDLFLINNSKDSDVTINVNDQDGNVLGGLFVKLLRFYPGNNTFRNVEIARTGNDGKTVERIILNDVLYQFVVSSKNNTLFTSNTQKVLSTNIFLNVNTISSYIDNLKKKGEVQYTLTFNNNTGRWFFTYNDLNNIVQMGCLDVTRKGASDTLQCHNCTQSTAGSLSCTINTSTQAIFTAVAYIESNTRNSPYFLESDERNQIRDFITFGATGILIQLMLLCIIVGIGVWKPSVALAFAIVSVITTAAMGLSGVGYSASVVFVLLFIFMLALTKD